MKIFDYLKNSNRFKVVYLLFGAILAVSQIYYSYRYIFQFGSETTSQTYHPTPTAFEITKYLIFAAFYLVLFLLFLPDTQQIYREKIRPHLPFWLTVLAFAGLVFLKLLLGSHNPNDFSFTQNLKMLFVIPIVFIVPILIRYQFPKKFLAALLIFSFAFHFLYELIQMALFFAIHRLPNLTFAPTFPRYGGGWDDPNSFAALTVLFLIIWIVYDYRKNKLLDYAVLVTLVLLTLLTYSITGLLGIFISGVALLLLRAVPLPKAAIVALTVAAFGLWHYLLGLVPLLIKAKQYSSVGHLANNAPHAASGGGGSSPLDFLIGTFGPQIFHENIYVQFFYNFGLIGVALFVLIILATIFAGIRGYLHYQKTDDPRRILFLSITVYLIAYSFMNVGIPSVQIFPINLFVWLAIGLIWALSDEITWKKLVGLDLIERLTHRS